MTDCPLPLKMGVGGSLLPRVIYSGVQQSSWLFDLLLISKPERQEQK